MTNHEAGGANNNPEAEGSKEERSETTLRTFGQEALKSLTLRSGESNVDRAAEPGADENPTTPDADTSTFVTVGPTTVPFDNRSAVPPSISTESIRTTTPDSIKTTTTSTAEYVPTTTTTPLESTTTTPTPENGDGITETITTTTRVYEDSDNLPHTVESTTEDYSSGSRTITTSDDLPHTVESTTEDYDNLPHTVESTSEDS